MGVLTVVTEEKMFTLVLEKNKTDLFRIWTQDLLRSEQEIPPQEFLSRWV